ncbi:Uncharacterised protein [Vibrio cholerae]|nr:Uncharacterised protein [Vibrio cholerae]CSI51275.1 Uncharacterised protein [Vibrio cholerae]CSI54367.1 Uncharacterised protein [Vibrio cholerae]
MVIESSLTSSLISVRYKSAAFQRDSNSTSRVIVWVTKGLPSRSPPIQDEKCTGRASIGKPSPR